LWEFDRDSGSNVIECTSPGCAVSSRRAANPARSKRSAAAVTVSSRRTPADLDRARLTLAYGSALLAGLLVFAIVSLLLFDRFEAGQRDLGLRSTVEQLAAIERAGAAKFALDSARLAAVQARRESDGMAIAGPDGRAAASFGAPLPQPIAAAAAAGATPTLLTVKLGEKSYRLATLRLAGDRGAKIALAWRDDDTDEALDRNLILAFLLGTPVVLLTAVLGGWTAAGRGLTPLRTMAAKAEAFVRAAPRALVRAVRAVLHNAVVHAQTAVRVTSIIEDSAVRLRVSDDGAGFSQAALAHAKERFWREDGARGRGGGTGLGLPIAETIVTGMGGSIELANGESGANVTFTSRSHKIATRSPALEQQSTGLTVARSASKAALLPCEGNLRALLFDDLDRAALFMSSHFGRS
jgi:signal transduction histidine kinase